MKLEDFKESINKVEDNLSFETISDHIVYRGVCDALRMVFFTIGFTHKVVSLFYDLCQPKSLRCGVYWLGPKTKEYLQFRIDKLREFEAHVIKEELYLEL